MKRGLSVISCLLTSLSVALAQPPLTFVNTLIGTASPGIPLQKKQGTYPEGNGQAVPSTGRPFGMIQWTPETSTPGNKSNTPYHYDDKTVTGFRGTNWISSQGNFDCGSISIMPFATGKPDTLKSLQSSRFSHKNETATPHYNSLMLDNHDITTEITGTERSGFFRLTYPGKMPGFITIRMINGEQSGKIQADEQKNEIVGYNIIKLPANLVKRSSESISYYVIKTDKPFRVISQLQGSHLITISVGTEKSVCMKIGVSFTSSDAARGNMEKESPGWDFDATRKASEDTWNKTLGKIQVRGGSEDERMRFYSALYRCFCIPVLAGNADGSYFSFENDTTGKDNKNSDHLLRFSPFNSETALDKLIRIIEPGKNYDIKYSSETARPRGIPFFSECSDSVSYRTETILHDLDEMFDKQLYDHGDYASHHKPFLYSMAGAPEKTQKLVQNIISSEYGSGPGGLKFDPGGETSAWLVFAMMGFYPVCPASGQYVISTPVFDEVKIYLPGNKFFLITPINRTGGTSYIRAITKDGGRYQGWTFNNSDILQGSRFTFQLDSKPPVK